MNRPIAMLMHEHVIIMKVVNALGSLSNDLAQGHPVDTEWMREAVHFMQGYADRCHHGKEEDILFPEMAGHGVPEHGCPLDALRNEHAQGRHLVSELAEAVEAYALDRLNATKNLLLTIGKIGHLYPSHIWKEDNMVFPMVDRLFTVDERDDLARRFDEAEVSLCKDHDRFEVWAQQLPEI